MKIGNNIKFYRKQKGLTQKQLAEKIGATDSAITRYESNSREPSIETITKISEALGVPVIKLIEADKLKKLTESSNIGYNIKKYRKLARMTQVELAQKINKSESTIRKYEANNVKPNFSVIDDIANILGCTRIDLVNNTDITINSILKSNYLEQYIKSLGYEIDGSLVPEDYLFIKSTNGTYEITEKDLEELETTIKSFVLFKIQEIINNSRKMGK